MVLAYETVSENRSFGGVQGVYRHASQATGTPMTFAVYLPPDAAHRKVPVLWYLSGLTCTHENAMVKAGAQEWASEAGIALIFPDTSPRGEGVADDPAYDLGQGAGFYVDATQAPWAPHFKMWHYVTHELPDLVFGNFALDREAQGITGHSMGGHGALTIAMTFPQRYKSVSAFAPIANPSDSDWGRKQLTAYLGEDRAAWAGHDATLLMRGRKKLARHGTGRVVWADRAPAISSWTCSSPKCWRRPWPNGVSPACSACSRAMTTAISLCRPSWAITSTGTPNGWAKPVPPAWAGQ